MGRRPQPPRRRHSAARRAPRQPSARRRRAARTPRGRHASERASRCAHSAGTGSRRPGCACACAAALHPGSSLCHAQPAPRRRPRARALRAAAWPRGTPPGSSLAAAPRPPRRHPRRPHPPRPGPCAEAASESGAPQQSWRTQRRAGWRGGWRARPRRTQRWARASSRPRHPRPCPLPAPPQESPRAALQPARARGQAPRQMRSRQMRPRSHFGCPHTHSTGWTCPRSRAWRAEARAQNVLGRGRHHPRPLR
mmetsp:Transcript_12105/g.31669  ORF Transcript_12105/g.31669 Transcript_12105/m.31669 type:complete len:252 (+) Transcript_12105:1349-2104(+)